MYLANIYTYHTKLFWTNGPLFIRELLELQGEPKPHYNTLSTIVRVLEEKGYISYHFSTNSNLRKLRISSLNWGFR